MPQFGQTRGLLPSAFGGKMCGPRIWFISSMTCEIFRSFVPPTAAEKSFQKSRKQLLPLQRAFGDFVELLFKVGGEAVFDIAVEEGREERRDQAALVFRHEAAAIHPHIGAVAQHRKDRRIGRRPSDAEFLQLAHKACFGIARRRFGEMLRGVDLLDVGLLSPAGEARQLRAVFVALVVLAFLIEREEAVEQSHRAGGAQRDLAVGGRDVDGRAFEFCAFHLAGDGALPDQLIELGLIGIERARRFVRRAVEAGRADGFVRFLRVLGLAGVDARRAGHIFLAIARTDDGARLVDRLRRPS